MDNLIRAHQNFVNTESKNSPSLLPLRNEGMQKFLNRGLPRGDNEDWKYTNVKGLNKYLSFYELLPQTSSEDLSQFLEKMATLKNRVVILNGKFVKAMSSFCDLSIGKTESIDLANPFVDLNQAFLMEGIEFKFKKSQKYLPLEIIHISSQAAAYNSRIKIKLEAHSEVEVLESFYSMGTEPKFFNSVTTIEMDEGSRLKHALLQSVGKESAVVSHVSARLKKNAVAYFLNSAVSYSWSRNDVDAKLEGEGAEAFLNGLYTPGEGQIIDHCTKVFHLLPNTTSHQLYKGVLVGKSKSIFNGKIKIAKDAQKSSAEQLNKNIVFETRSEAITRPQLEIDADDVKATHGATVGKLNEEELFYLESRGIPEKLAKQVLIEGFIKEVLDVSVSGELKNRIEQAMNLGELIRC